MSYCVLCSHVTVRATLLLKGPNGGTGGLGLIPDDFLMESKNDTFHVSHESKINKNVELITLNGQMGFPRVPVEPHESIYHMAIQHYQVNKVHMY